MDSNDGKPVTDLAISYPLDRLEYAQVALGEHFPS